MKQEFKIENEVIVRSTTDRVWEVLTDFETYHEWNPFMRKVEGLPIVGKRLRVEMILPNEHQFMAKPKIKVCNELKELRWVSRLYLPGVYDNEHYFQLEMLGPHRTKLIHGEICSGFAAKGVFPKMQQDLEAAFKLMDQALKKRCKSLMQ